MSILERLSALLAPDDCLKCGSEGALLCSVCSSRCFTRAERCFRCLGSCQSAVCDTCLAEIPCTSLQAAYAYQGVSKQLVTHLKFAQNQTAARLMARAIYERCSLPKKGLLTYMPATNAHVRERGFDQGRLIVRELSRLTGMQRADVLRRGGNLHQLGSSREQRLQQLTGQLDVIRPRAVRGHTIIVVDDVITTGSSLLAATSALRTAGAQQVHGIAFAQAIAGRRASQ